MPIMNTDGFPELNGYQGAIDANVMRRLNGARILDTVRRYGPISRAGLARRSRLSPPTVSALVEDLKERRGLLRQVGMGESSGGRRPMMLEFNADYGYVAGVDLGSTTTRFALADLQGRMIYRHQQKTPSASREAVIEEVFDGIRRLFPGSGLPPKRLFAIGIGAPGMTDVEQGRVISAVNLKNWTDVPLRALLQDRFGVPVVVDNDVNMAALGEHWAGCARRHPNFVFIALGAGVGAGIVIDGRLHRGSHWYAGEISHMHLDFRRWAVEFGEQGFLERHAGAAAIARMGQRVEAARRNGGARAGGREAMEPARLFEAARAGDRAAARVVQQVAVYLGMAVANIVSVLDPALVVFGGGISLAGNELLDPVKRVVARLAPNCPDLRLTALGDEAQLYGSVYSGMQLAQVRLFESL
jgi:glucokinase